MPSVDVWLYRSHSAAEMQIYKCVTTEQGHPADATQLAEGAFTAWEDDNNYLGSEGWFAARWSPSRLAVAAKSYSAAMLHCERVFNTHGQVVHNGELCQIKFKGLM